MLTGLAEFSAETTGQTGEAVTCERADKDADNDVAEVVLADEDAADRYHERQKNIHQPYALSHLGMAEGETAACDIVSVILEPDFMQPC